MNWNIFNDWSKVFFISLHFHFIDSQSLADLKGSEQIRFRTFSIPTDELPLAIHHLLFRAPTKTDLEK